MASIDSILDQLKQERDRLDAAIRALEGVSKNGTGRGGRRGRRKGWKMSAEARAKIAAAQRARWAKARKAKRAVA